MSAKCCVAVFVTSIAFSGALAQQQNVVARIRASDAAVSFLNVWSHDLWNDKISLRGVDHIVRTRHSFFHSSAPLHARPLLSFSGQVSM